MSDVLGIHGTALAVREKRLQLIAANIANADTPQYQAQDLDFTTALRSALQPGSGATGPRGDAIQQAAASAQYLRPASQPSLDGNTVDGDRENATYAQAVVEYRASLSFIESKVRSMLTAITGQ